MTTVTDNFGLILKALLRLAGVIMSVLSYLQYKYNVFSGKKSEYLMVYIASLTNIAIFYTLTLIFSTIKYEGTLNETIRSTVADGNRHFN